MRSQFQGKLATLEVRKWDVITVVVMLTVSILGAVWMVHLG